MLDIHWFKEYLSDFLFLGASALLLIAYHQYLRLCLRKNPHYTIQGVLRAARAAWVEDVMHDPSRSIVGVQTLRNSTMAATFLASTSVLLIMGTLTLSGQSDKLMTSWHQLNVVGSAHAGIWITKVLFLLSAFLVAFFSFAMDAGIDRPAPEPRRTLLRNRHARLFLLRAPGVLAVRPAPDDRGNRGTDRGAVSPGPRPPPPTLVFDLETSPCRSSAA